MGGSSVVLPVIEVGTSIKLDAADRALLEKYNVFAAHMAGYTTPTAAREQGMFAQLHRMPGTAFMEIFQKSSTAKRTTDFPTMIDMLVEAVQEKPVWDLFKNMDGTILPGNDFWIFRPAGHTSQGGTQSRFGSFKDFILSMHNLLPVPMAPRAKLERLTHA